MMATKLVRYKDLSPAELSRPLHRIAVLNESQLRTRHLLGVIARYGQDAQDAVIHATAAIRSDEATQSVLHFAVVDTDVSKSTEGLVVGSASIYRGLKLRMLHGPIPPALADRLPVLATEYPKASVNVSAWTDDGSRAHLQAAYAGLASELRDEEREWTIEPVRSPDFVHDAIQAAGLERRGSQGSRYDDSEVRRHIPPVAHLYGNPAIV